MPALRYQDQNNNVYLIKDGQLDYTPIKPNQSSSGVYSGGKAVQKKLSEDEITKIFALVKKIVKKPSVHTPQRRMMTAIMACQLDKDWQRFTLLRSDLRTQLETLLLEAINQ